MAHQGVGGQEDLRGAVCLGDEGGQPTPTVTWVRGDGPPLVQRRRKLSPDRGWTGQLIQSSQLSLHGHPVFS